MSLSRNYSKDIMEKPCLVEDKGASYEESTQGYVSATESDSAQEYNSATESNSAQESCTATKSSTTDCGTSKSQTTAVGSEEKSVKRRPPPIIIQKKEDWNRVRQSIKEDEINYLSIKDTIYGIRLQVSNDNEHRLLTSYLLQKDIKFRTHLFRDEYVLPKHITELLKRKNKARRACILYPTKDNRRNYRALNRDAKRIVLNYKFNLWELTVSRRMSHPTRAHDFLTAPGNILHGFTCDPHALEHYLKRCYVYPEEKEEAVNDHYSLVCALQEFIGWPVEGVGVKKGNASA